MCGIKWKSFTNYTIEGKPFQDDASAFNEDASLFNRITLMPKRDRTISIHAAFTMYWEDIASNVVEVGDLDLAGSVTQQDWVSWISKQGYQIVLTGSEFEGSIL